MEADMTVQELSTFLKEHLVPAKFYKSGGSHNNRICIEQTEDGWEVFFSEKKEKVGLMRYEDENSACMSMKNEMRKLMESVYGLTWAR